MENLINEFENNTLLIVPSYLKKQVLKYINSREKLYSYKIMSKEEFISNYKFSTDEKAVSYLFYKYNYSYDVILEYLTIIPYLEDKKYNSKKLNNLLILRDELNSKGLLNYNKIFNPNLYKIVVYSDIELDSYYKNIFDSFNATYIINISESKKINCFCFSTITEEAAYTFSEIRKLIDSGISISDINIYADDTYSIVLNRISRWFNIPINNNSNKTIWDVKLGKRVIELLEYNNSFDDVLEKIKDEKYVKDILKVFNNYYFLNGINDNYKLIKEVFKRTNVSDKKINGVNISSLSYSKYDSYNYVLGFNQELIPVTYKDENIINDIMMEELGLYTSLDLNKNEKVRVKNIINSTSNISISYKERDSREEYKKSLLLNELDVEIKKIDNYNYLSNFYNNTVFVDGLDYFNKYGVIKNNIRGFYNRDILNNYNSYDNSFSGIDKDLLNKHFNNKLTLSYSSLDNYFKCSFRYYLNSVLSISKFESSFYTEVGNVFHNILSIAFDDGFDFETEFQKEIEKYDFKNSEKFLLNKLKDELEFDIKTIKKQNSIIGFNKSIYENKFLYNVLDYNNIKIDLIGFIDKIMYLECGNRTLASIIDYKTGTLPSNLNNIIYGIGMQLPIYYYLLKRSNRFNNLKIVGMYLQSIINKDNNINNKTNILLEKEKNLQLVGYSTTNVSDLENFDTTYENSELIKNMKLTDKGFYYHAKVFDDVEFDNMDKLVDDLIKGAGRDIVDGKFDINPKRIGKDEIGCKFCEFRDICFKKEENFIDKEKFSKLEFLRGDNNA